MQSLDESQNPIQHCVDKFSKFVKTSEERAEAIRMAWEGYD